MFGAGTSEKHWTVSGPGHVIDGGVVSLTVIVCVQVREVAARVRRPGRSG